MWNPVNTNFFVPQLPVALVSLPDSGGRGPVLRGLLEGMNCVVLSHYIGTPSDFLKVIAQTETAPRYMVILGHGQEEGLYFGCYSPEIDTSMLKGECLPPSVIAQNVALSGCTILADCCYGATPQMAAAFLAGGASGFIGSPKALGLELTVFMVNFSIKHLAGA